jgi:hypothetical protein
MAKTIIKIIFICMVSAFTISCSLNTVDTSPFTELANDNVVSPTPSVLQPPQPPLLQQPETPVAPIISPAVPIVADTNQNIIENNGTMPNEDQSGEESTAPGVGQIPSPALIIVVDQTTDIAKEEMSESPPAASSVNSDATKVPAVEQTVQPLPKEISDAAEDVALAPETPTVIEKIDIVAGPAPAISEPQTAETINRSPTTTDNFENGDSVDQSEVEEEVIVAGECKGHKKVAVIWYDKRNENSKGNSSANCKNDKFEFKLKFKKNDAPFILVQTVSYSL